MGMGSDSDCLLGQSNGILEKTGGVDGGERVLETQQEKRWLEREQKSGSFLCEESGKAVVTAK